MKCKAVYKSGVAAQCVDWVNIYIYIYIYIVCVLYIYIYTVLSVNEYSPFEK